MARPTPAPADPELPQVINLEDERADLVQADLVRMHRSLAGEIDADEVELQSGAIGQVQAGHVHAVRSLIGMAQAAEVQVTGMAGIVRAETAGVQGSAGIVIADSLTLEQAHAGVVAGREVHAERIETKVLLAGRVEGEVHTLLDTRGAIIAGALAGLVAGVLFLAGRALFGGHKE